MLIEWSFATFGPDFSLDLVLLNTEKETHKVVGEKY
jgi:hypothetical protein